MLCLFNVQGASARLGCFTIRRCSAWMCSSRSRSHPHRGWPVVGSRQRLCQVWERYSGPGSRYCSSRPVFWWTTCHRGIRSVTYLPLTVPWSCSRSSCCRIHCSCVSWTRKRLTLIQTASVHFVSKGDALCQKSENKKACRNTNIPWVLEVLHNCCICRCNFPIKCAILKILRRFFICTPAADICMFRPLTLSGILVLWPGQTPLVWEINLPCSKCCEIESISLRSVVGLILNTCTQWTLYELKLVACMSVLHKDCWILAILLCICVQKMHIFA